MMDSGPREVRLPVDVDPLDAFRAAAFGVVRNGRVADALATELALAHYAFGAWQARPHVPIGSIGLTHHIRSGYGGTLVAVMLLVALEGFVVHLLVARSHAILAWGLTLLTLYGALWFVADFRATVLRPILVTNDDVLIRAGLRCTLRAPRSAITSVRRTRPEAAAGRISLTIPGAPTHWICFSETLVARGPYGVPLRVRAVGIEPDDPAAFERAMAGTDLA